MYTYKGLLLTDNLKLMIKGKKKLKLKGNIFPTTDTSSHTTFFKYKVLFVNTYWYLHMQSTV